MAIQTINTPAGIIQLTNEQINQFKQQPPAQAEPTAPPATGQLTPEAFAALDEQGKIAAVAEFAFPGEALEFGNIFAQAQENFGQPVSDVTDNPDTRVLISNATKALAGNFAKRIFDKTGKSPSIQQVREFVAGAFDVTFAEDILQSNATGGLTNEQIVGRFVDPIVKGREGEFTPKGSTEEQGTPQGNLRKQFDELFPQALQAGAEQIRQQFIRPKQELAAQQAATGRLTSRVGAVPERALAGQEATALSGLVGQLAQQRIGAETGFAGQLAELAQRQREASTSGRQFQQQFAFQQRGQRIGERQQRQSLALSEQLGRLQADANKPSLTGQIFGGLNALSGLASGVGLLGAGLSGLGSKKK